MHTCQHLKFSMGEITRELLHQPRTGQRDLCGRILGIVIAHEITNETTTKTSTSQHLNHTTCKYIQFTGLNVEEINN